MEGVGVRRARGRYRDRAGESRDRRSEGSCRVVTRGDAARHEGGNDLRVGGDLGGDGESFLRSQLEVVVDVAVERGDDVRAARGAVGLLGVERVGVGLADDPDARPPGVAEDRRGRAGCRHGPTEEAVGGDRGPEVGGVVAQLTDLGRRLVDEPEAAVDDPHAAVGEERVRARLDLRRDRSIAGIDAVVVDQHVHAGRVASADLESIDRRERDLDREVGRDRVLAARVPCEAGDGTRVAHPVVPHRPHRVLHLDEGRVRAFERGAGEAALVEGSLDAADPVPQPLGPRLDLLGHAAVADQGPGAGDPTQQPVECPEGIGRGEERLLVGLLCERRLGAVQEVEQLTGIRHRPAAGRAENGDDATHG
jgi:hypothetical protein